MPEDTQKRKSHFAAYPLDLCRIPILATCPENGIALDPFSGTGSTLIAAYELGRKSVGIDIFKTYYGKVQVIKMSKIIEIFGLDTHSAQNWERVIQEQHCPFRQRVCYKTRKSDPSLAIGTCTVLYGRDPQPVMICPARLLERGQIFADCLHLLTNHEPGNELHVVPEVRIPGGSVDFFLVSVRNNRVRDFVGIEYKLWIPQGLFGLKDNVF